LVFTLNGQDFNDKFSMEYGFYMASNQEVLLTPSSSSWMNKLILIMRTFCNFSWIGLKFWVQAPILNSYL
jgi:hypothetical protein